MQLLFPIGTLLLVVSSSAAWLRWLPGIDPQLKRIEIILWTTQHLVLYLAAAGSLVFIFQPREKALRRLRTWVLLPTVAIIVLRLVEWSQSTARDSSVLGPLPPDEGALLYGWARIGLGFHAAFLGVACLACGMWMAHRGRVRLPVAFRDAVLSDSPDDVASRKRILTFVFAAMTLPLLGGAFSWPLLWVFGEDRLLKWMTEYHGAWQWISLIPGTAMVAVCAWLLLRRPGDSLRAVCRIGSWRGYAVALLASLGPPVVTVILFWISYEVLNYFRPHDFGRVEPVEWIPRPSFRYAGTLLPAFFEEVAWRAWLQPRMVEQFGFRRGIFLLSLGWGIWHVSGDVGGMGSVADAGFAVIRRLATILVSGALLGWLYARSGSLGPVTLEHGLHNVVIRSTQMTVRWIDFPAAAWLSHALRLALVLWLYRRYPAESTTRSEPPH